MVQLVCPCLNIRIHAKDSTVQLQDSCALNLSQDALADNFFSSQVYNVLLDLGGVTKAQKNLCTSRSVDGWVVTSCVGCQLDVYAKHLDDSDRVLVNCGIEDPSHITTLMESENYSSLFKLLLPEVNDNFMQNNIGVELSSSSSSLEHALKHIQQQVSSYLREEQKAMEERIRIFTEQQQSRYSALQQKVRKHKQAMVYLLLKKKDLKTTSENKQLFESLSPPSPLTPPQNSSDESSSSSDSANVQSKSQDFPMKTIEQVQELPPQPKRPFRRMHSVNNPPRAKVKGGRHSKQVPNIDVGDVFDMEGFETGEINPPFDHSDDETDGSSTEDSVPSKREGPASKHIYAGSLPITVPAWSSYSRYSIDEDEEDHVVHHKDPEQLAASFRALVEGVSVQDGTEIFGDLPRRRLNTGDLVKSRPI